MKKTITKKKLIKKPVAKKPVKKLVKKAVKVIKKKPVKKPAVKKAVKAVSKAPGKTVRKPAAARKARKKSIQIKKSLPVLEGTLVGEITHYFPKANAAVVKLQIPLAVGDMIKVKGHTTDFSQKLGSIQIDRAAVLVAQVGDIIGIQVKSRVRRGDIVIRL